MRYTAQFLLEFASELKQINGKFESEYSTYVEVCNNVLEEEKRHLLVLQEKSRKSIKALKEEISRDLSSLCTRITSRHADSKTRVLLLTEEQCKYKIVAYTIKYLQTNLNINDRYLQNINRTSKMSPNRVDLESILLGGVDYFEYVVKIEKLMLSNNDKEVVALYDEFCSVCQSSMEVLGVEIDRLTSEIDKELKDAALYSKKESGQAVSFLDQKYIDICKFFNAITSEYMKASEERLCHKRLALEDAYKSHKKNVVDIEKTFCEKFGPEELLTEYKRIYSEEPNYNAYECTSDIPESIYVSKMIYCIDSLNLCDETKRLLNKYYYFIYTDNNIMVPYCTSFNSDFNYLFRFGGEGRPVVISDACNFAMRLFTMLPPGKLNFTFLDPVTLGESFAVFTQLIDVNNNTSEIINGKIWSNPTDIEEKLRVMTDHIANVTQRCLQGKYNNIYEYNLDAEQNAEAYQVIMMMDFPTGLTDQSMKLLEQIATSGPKCGVFTILYRNESQFKKVSEKSYPLVLNIEKNFQNLTYSGSCDEIRYMNDKIKNNLIKWKNISIRCKENLDNIINKLKLGIKNAEKIVISFNKIIPAKEEWFKGDCSKELSIPIGIHGANNIQNLTFGIGGSHHALVAGQTGAGKSSLLHTIIMSALIKYPANQLQIFLVDFKRGVEFKIYANYSLENFKVIAIESEREFGCSVLEFLDVEQSRRAEKFKKYNVDNVNDYRIKSGEILPRILLIIDEFHVLFSKDASDVSSKNSAAFLEQIIRQGRAFGIHVILASQTMSNIGGINYGVWGQVGVRIALKCPKADAKFVLGGDNDGVDLLSSENPGQAIYNSDCGNVISNTIFRVAYIEQEEQDAFLRYISTNSLKFGYSETRVMLSNVEDNIYSPFQKFIRGEDYDFKDNCILVGEPLKIINNMKMRFKNKQSSNMLVIGNDEQKIRTLFTFAVLSMALHKLSINGNVCSQTPDIYLFDYAPLEDFYEKDILIELSKMLPHFIKYISFDEANDVMKELYEEFLRREKGQSEIKDAYMLVYGLQRARDLRSNNVYQTKNTVDDFDEFGGSPTQQLTAKPHEMFMNLLQRGASVGINALVWEDNFKVFMAHYANMLSNFDMRVAFTMSDEDSINFIEDPNGSKIGENSAVYSYNGNQKFRPYKKPDLEWLKTLCDKMETI